MPHWLRPDKSHVMFVPKPPEEGRPVVEVWELIPNSTQKRKVVQWMREAQDKNRIKFVFKNHWSPTREDLEAYRLPVSENLTDL